MAKKGSGFWSGEEVRYLCDFCNSEGLNLGECIAQAWDVVSKRDWRADPVNATSAAQEGGVQ